MYTFSDIKAIKNHGKKYEHAMLQIEQEAWVGINTRTGFLMGIGDETSDPFDAYNPAFSNVKLIKQIYLFRDEESIDRYLKYFPDYRKSIVKISIVEITGE